MVVYKSTVQKSGFEDFYPTTLAFSAAKKNFFLGHSKDKSYTVYSLADNGKIDDKAPIQKGKLLSYLSNLQAFYDTTQNKQFLYGYNLETKVFQFYQIADNASITLLLSDEFAVENTIKSTTMFLSGGILHIFIQAENNKEWYIYKVNFVEA
ncbi:MULTISPECIES: XRE family transcriptional regulator [unclassified Providencia]|uniref:XRE family transcriptional regulator n=2 Tax=Providencia TaxID=586 RepID=UPI000E8FCAFD|nr:XRE family transcriptional regulator [Providencia sp.]MBP6081432.1 XRE family transcriptional regulator [Providencia sp.]HBO24938.1 XRE family transcriptional regulator [Providencia sp.]